MDRKREKNLKKDIERAIRDIEAIIDNPNEKREIIIKVGKPGSVTGISDDDKIIYTVPREYVDRLNSKLYVDISDNTHKKGITKLLNSRIAKRNASKSKTKNPRFIDER